MSEEVEKIEFGNRVIVVTGGGSDQGSKEVGFGYQTAKDLFDAGATVAILGRNIERLRNAMENIIRSRSLFDERFSYHQCDVANQTRVKEVMELIKGTHGVIYGLVNNAGINLSFTDTVSTSNKVFYQTLLTNTYGAFNCLRAVIPQMAEAGEGSIVNVSSVGAGEPFEDMVAYCTSKAAMESLSRCVALDHFKDGIRSNVIRPGRSLTPLTAESLSDSDRLQETLESQPFGGLVTPEQVSQGIQVLLDPKSEYTGEILEVANRMPNTIPPPLTIPELSYKLSLEARVSSAPPPPKEKK